MTHDQAAGFKRALERIRDRYVWTPPGKTASVCKLCGGENGDHEEDRSCGIAAVALAAVSATGMKPGQRCTRSAVHQPQIAHRFDPPRDRGFWGVVEPDNGRCPYVEPDPKG